MSRPGPGSGPGPTGYLGKINVEEWLMDQDLEDIITNYETDTLPEGIEKEEVFQLFRTDKFWFDYLHARGVNHRFWNDINVLPVDRRTNRFLENWREAYNYYYDYLYYHPEEQTGFQEVLKPEDDNSDEEILENILSEAKNSEEFRERILSVLKLKYIPGGQPMTVSKMLEQAAYMPFSTQAAAAYILRGRNSFARSLVLYYSFLNGEYPEETEGFSLFTERTLKNIFELVWEIYQDSSLYAYDIITTTKGGLVDLSTGINSDGIKDLLDFFSFGERYAKIV